MNLPMKPSVLIMAFAFAFPASAQAITLRTPKKVRAQQVFTVIVRADEGEKVCTTFDAERTRGHFEGAALCANGTLRLRLSAEGNVTAVSLHSSSDKETAQAVVRVRSRKVRKAAPVVG
jgi:hypothetical protein